MIPMPHLKPQKIHLLCEAKAILDPKQADEADKEPKAGRIVATATNFGPRETVDGRKFFYTSEGFKDWADEFNKSERAMPMFLNHMAEALPVGEWDKISMDDDEMTAEGSIYMNTTGGKDLYEVLKNAPMMMGGVSIGAYADEACMVDQNGAETDDVENGYFSIKKGGIKEISVVLSPANPKAEIKHLEKFIGNEINPRYVEKALRSCGIIKADAVKATAVLKSIYAEMRDAAPIIEINAKDDQLREAEQSSEMLLATALDEQLLLRQLNRNSDHGKGNTKA